MPLAIRFRYSPEVTPANPEGTYRLRMAPDGTPILITDPPVYEGIPDPDPADGNYGLLPLTPEWIPALADVEGSYDFTLRAVDRAGNPSPPLPFENVPLDFVPPAAPTEGSIVEI